MDQNRRIFVGAAAGAALLHALPLRAQAPFPARPVRMIVPVGVGTTTDLVGRIIAQRLSQAWDQGVVVENQPGSAGVIGMQALAKSAPDGYTIGAISSNFAINTALYPKLPYDLKKDFKPILNVASNYFVFVVNPQFPARSIAELVALAKAKPGAIDFASTGNGGAPHLAVEMLAFMAGIKLNHIPYKATGPAVTDVLAGRVPIIFTSVSTLLPHIRDGKLRALAVSGLQRVPQLPDVPTADEAGVKGYDMKHWVGMVAPAGVPDALVAKLQADIAATLKGGDIEAQLAAQAVEVDLLPPAGLTKRIDEEIALWARVAKASGAKVE